MMRKLQEVLALTALAMLEVGPLLAADSTGATSNGRFLAVTLGLGVQAHGASSLADYINRIALPSYNDRLSEFTTVPELFVSPEFQVSDEWSVGIDYGYLVRSYAISGVGVGPSQFDYAVHTPTAIVHYLIPGNGYWVKLGGGVGYHFGEFSQRLYGSNESVVFRAKGLGMKLDAVADTKFDDHLYGSFELDLRWAIGGSFRGGGVAASVGGTTASLNFFAVSLRFGVMIVV